MRHQSNTWLVPWAEDTASTRAFEEAIRLAAANDASVELFHAISHLPDPFEPMLVDIGDGGRRLDPHLYAIADKMRERLEQVSETCRQGTSVSVTTFVALGTPVETILARLNEGSYRGVVMGTHSRKTFERWMLGSVAEKIARDAPCPVVLIPAGLDGEPLFPPRRIAACVDVAWPDPQAADVHAVLQADALAQGSGARIDVVHAVELAADIPMLSNPQVEVAMTKTRHAEIERRRGRLQMLCKRVASDLQVRAELLFREPREGVGQAVERWVKQEGVQLVVTAAHNKSWTGRMLGSVANRIARTSSVAVMVVKPPMDIDR